MENLVKQYHKEQFRNDRPGFVPPKIPYFDHLIGVKTILSSALLEFGECPDCQAFQDLCAAALGHDLIEDTEVSENEIIQATNVHVLSLYKRTVESG
jgi:(p)ppGpp synthase/HD superfamily hydrolase